MQKKYYLTLDTETCTLPFANDICKDEKQKQKIAIAKPLVYDIGWVISDRKGNIIKKENYLVQETFFVPSVFNTAYYKDKRPVYIDLISKNEIKVDTWKNIISILVNDLEKVCLSTAYNACFDFKKAIPFTEKYITNLYSSNYNNWEKEQKKHCLKIIEGKDESKNKDFLIPSFTIREKTFPITDLWTIACKTLLNNSYYKNYCLNNNLVSHSIEYFKTSAETAFQYLLKEHNFIEEHTALSDAIIESKILTKALIKGKVKEEISAFPFKALGTTVDYVEKKTKYKEKVKSALFDFLLENNGFEKMNNGYWARIVKLYERLISEDNEVE